MWAVTELADGSSYTWESSSPGITVTAAHLVEPHPDGSRLTLGWLLTRSLSKRYVETEAASIKRAAETSAR